MTSAFRQVLAAAVRWRYIERNPAVDAGRNPQPRREELQPFTPDEIDKLAVELGPVYGPLAVFAAETGLRTNEWVALERRDLDRSGQAVAVQRRSADGSLTPYPKTVRSRRRVPLTAGRSTRSTAAAEDRHPSAVPGRRDGGHLGLDNWRTREWYPALEAAGIAKRGPYHLRHTFATEALAPASPSSSWPALMGASVKMIDETYGHLTRDSEETIRARLDARSNSWRFSGRGGSDSRTTEGAQSASEGIELTGATGLEPATSGVTGRNGEETSALPGKQSQVSYAVSPPH